MSKKSKPPKTSQEQARNKAMRLNKSIKKSQKNSEELYGFAGLTAAGTVFCVLAAKWIAVPIFAVICIGSLIAGRRSSSRLRLLEAQETLMIDCKDLDDD